MSWLPGVRGEAAVAERDQFEAEIADIIGKSRLFLLVALPVHEDDPRAALVRGASGLPLDMDPEERAELLERFLVTARIELDQMIESLDEVGA